MGSITPGLENHLGHGLFGLFWLIGWLFFCLVSNLRCGNATLSRNRGESSCCANLDKNNLHDGFAVILGNLESEVVVIDLQSVMH